MLKQMREGAKSTTLKLALFGMLLMAMAGLALMDVQGMFRGGVRNNVAASYKGGQISSVEFDRILQSALRDQGIRPSDAYKAGLPRQILEQEIETRLFSRAADDLGLRIEDAEAAKQIKQMIAPLTQKGLSQKAALQRLLQVYGMNEAMLVASIKSHIATQQMVSALVAGARAPQQMAQEALRYRHEWRRGEYFRLSADTLPAVKSPSDDELKKYYDSIAADYAEPERRTLSVLVLDKKTMGSGVKVSEEKLRAYYEDNIADYRTPEKRTLSQVVATDEAVAKAIFTAAEKSKNLEKEAKAAGKDKASFIPPTTSTESDLPVELSKAAFLGKAGEVLAPLKSPLGWHVLHIEKVTPAVTKPFESLRASIEKDLVQDNLTEALYERANDIDDQIAGGKSLSEVAKENRIPETVLEKIDAHGAGVSGKKPDLKLPLYERLIENGFKLKEGMASQLIETPEGAFVIVGVREIIPAARKPFDQVRADVLARWKTEQKVRALSARASEISERLKKGEDFARIAADLRLPVQSTGLVRRTAKEGIDKDLHAALFSLEGIGSTTAVSQDSGLMLLRLAERKVQAPKEPGKEDVEMMDAIVNRALKQDILDQYRSHLMARYKVRINDDLLESLYAPKDEDALESE